jgi:hypothetical protein
MINVRESLGTELVDAAEFVTAIATLVAVFVNGYLSVRNGKKISDAHASTVSMLTKPKGEDSE